MYFKYNKFVSWPICSMNPGERCLQAIFFLNWTRHLPPAKFNNGSQLCDESLCVYHLAVGPLEWILRKLGFGDIIVKFWVFRQRQLNLTARTVITLTSLFAIESLSRSCRVNNSIQSDVVCTTIIYRHWKVHRIKITSHFCWMENTGYKSSKNSKQFISHCRHNEPHTGALDWNDWFLLKCNNVFIWESHRPIQCI